MDLKSTLRVVPDFPKAGIQFIDVTTLVKNGAAFQYVIDTWKARFAGQGITAIVGAEARGFIFGAALAYALGLPFIPVRKRGKLPAKTVSESFTLEYGTDSIEVHEDALSSGDRVVLIDDLLATGGTMGAMASLVQKLGAEVVEIAFVVELTFLDGRAKLPGFSVSSLVTYEGE